MTLSSFPISRPPWSGGAWNPTINQHFFEVGLPVRTGGMLITRPDHQLKALEAYFETKR